MGIFRHWAENLDLMGRMFARTGAAAVSGNEGALKGALMRCAGCGETQACHDFLDEAAEGSAPPDFCANAGLIERLRAAQV